MAVMSEPSAAPARGRFASSGGRQERSLQAVLMLIPHLCWQHAARTTAASDDSDAPSD